MQIHITYTWTWLTNLKGLSLINSLANWWNDGELSYQEFKKRIEKKSWVEPKLHSSKVWKTVKKGRPADFLCLSAKEWTPLSVGVSVCPTSYLTFGFVFCLVSPSTVSPLKNRGTEENGEILQKSFSISGSSWVLFLMCTNREPSLVPTKWKQEETDIGETFCKI